MFKKRQKIISGSLIALFVAFLFAFSSHFHTQSQGPEKDNCSICQASHSFQKQGLTPSDLNIFHIQSKEEIILDSQVVSSSHFLFSSPSRAPPANI